MFSPRADKPLVQQPRERAREVSTPEMIKRPLLRRPEAQAYARASNPFLSGRPGRVSRVSDNDQGAFRARMALFFLYILAARR